MENNIKNNSKEVTPKHFFLHFFTIVMLYIFTVNLVLLVFQSINIIFPDSLSRTIYAYVDKESIRFALASIIIVFPVFFFSSFFLNKSYKENSLIEKMKIRKWLVYFTLFVGGIVIVINLVTIVLWFLNGEITLRFILKAIFLLIVIGLIFAYYSRDIRQKISSKERKPWAISIIILFIASLILGFSLIGSPQKERLRQFDRQKIEDLSRIESQIVSYYQRKGYLPEKLSDLEDLISGFKVPLDYQVKNEPKEYEYSLLGENSFEICANFNLTSEESMEAYPIYYNEYKWTFEHGIGRECFTRTIDKELYPKLGPEEIIINK